MFWYVTKIFPPHYSLNLFLYLRNFYLSHLIIHYHSLFSHTHPQFTLSHFTFRLSTSVKVRLLRQSKSDHADEMYMNKGKKNSLIGPFVVLISNWIKSRTLFRSCLIPNNFIFFSFRIWCKRLERKTLLLYPSVVFSLLFTHVAFKIDAKAIVCSI